MEKIIIVDKKDREIGTAEKMQAHRDGLLHRAFSILIFNKEKKMLLQKRAHDKYHCAGLWTNACCSHPRQGERTTDAAHRRLNEEMGFDTELEERFVFEYRVEFDSGLTEHEIDHVFIGEYNKDPKINKDEAEDYRWISMDELKEDIRNNPKKYTPWFKIIIERLKENGIQ